MRTKLSLILSIIALSMLISACAGVAAAQDLTTPEGADKLTRTITVVGNGKVSLTPDIAYIFIGVHTQGPDAQEAVASNNQQTQAVVDAMTGLEVDEKDIRTSTFSIYPQQAYDDKGQPTGEITYMVDNNIYVTVRDLDKIGELLDATVKAGANSINGIQFDVEDKTKAQSEARKLAVKDAQGQAGELAEAAGVALGPVITITTTGGMIPQPMIYGKGGGAVQMEAAYSVPVSPGQMDITVDVTLVYEIQ